MIGSNYQETVDIDPLLSLRHSSRVMDPGTIVTRKMIIQLLEAARWAPSGGNFQPWRYIIFDRSVPDQLRKAQECLNDSNREWADQAPVLIISIAQMVRPNGKSNTRALHDLGLANENLLLQAVSMELNCRPMGGFDAEKVRLYFHVPENYIPVVMIAVGFPGNIENFSEDIQNKEKQPRIRINISEFSHFGGWGEKFPE